MNPTKPHEGKALKVNSVIPTSLDILEQWLLTHLDILDEYLQCDYVLCLSTPGQ